MGDWAACGFSCPKVEEEKKMRILPRTPPCGAGLIILQSPLSTLWPFRSWLYMALPQAECNQYTYCLRCPFPPPRRQLTLEAIKCLTHPQPHPLEHLSTTWSIAYSVRNNSPGDLSTLRQLLQPKLL